MKMLLYEDVYEITEEVTYNSIRLYYDECYKNNIRMRLLKEVEPKGYMISLIPLYKSMSEMY